MADTGQSDNTNQPNDKGTTRNSPSTDAINNQPEQQQHPTQARKTPKVKKEKWQATNTIAIVAIVVNAFMLLATYLLFNEANKGSKIAQESLDSAKAYTKRADALRRIERTEERQTQQKRDSLDSLSFQNQKRSVDTQITAFKDARTQFEIEHQPIIETFPDTLTFQDSTEFNLIYKIRTNSERPIETLEGTFDLDFIPFQDTISFMKNPFKSSMHPIKNHIYIFKGDKEKRIINGTDPNKILRNFDKAYNKVLKIYFVGKTKYAITAPIRSSSS